MIFITALRKELFEQWRTARLVIVVGVLALFGMTSPLLARFTPELLKMIPGTDAVAAIFPAPTILDAIGQYAKNVSQFGFILALLMTMGAVAVEKDRGTAALSLVKPLPRSVFLLAKFTALAVTFLIALTIAGFGAYYYTLVLFDDPGLAPWLAMNALLWLYCLTWIAITLCFSTLVRSQAAAVGLSFGLMLVISLFGISPVIYTYLPDQLIGWGVSIAARQDIHAVRALWVSLGLAAAALLGAWFIFRKQEL